MAGDEAVGCKTDLIGAMKGREGARRREAGRRRREVTMARTVGSLIGNQSTEIGRGGSYKIMVFACRNIFCSFGECWEYKSPALVKILRWDFGAELNHLIFDTVRLHGGIAKRRFERLDLWSL